MLVDLNRVEPLEPFHFSPPIEYWYESMPEPFKSLVHWFYCLSYEMQAVTTILVILAIIYRRQVVAAVRRVVEWFTFQRGVITLLVLIAGLQGLIVWHG